MSRPRTWRIVALTYVAVMITTGLVTGAHGPSPADPLVFWLSQPGLNVLYVFVLMPPAAMFGDLGGGGGEAGALGTALASGLGAAVNVLLLWGVLRFLRMIAADLPACRKRRNPGR
ncbi:hypothetical protein OG596_05880 [Streptomyces sp. NBC_01102]|uniref:hypothetical protein n=1 Tax=unclassified Streptomyces TaxID=2593676 RepID=UPI0038700F47|nr:hypothetical protein OG596_05880 [Streptomyces sp. NBC_01102]